MSFWNTSDNANAAQSTGAFETGGGDMEPIPSNTQLEAAIEEAKWDAYAGDEYVSLKWRVLKGDYAKRVIYQKVRVQDANEQKADKHKRMLAAISQNAGGGLLKLSHKPTDMDLMQNLLNKPMAIMVQIWKIDKDRQGNPLPKEEHKTGNWISAVAPRGGAQSAAAKPAQQAPQQQAQDDGDDIPF